MDESLATVKSMDPRQFDPCIEHLDAFNETIDRSDLLLTFTNQDNSKFSRFKHDYTAGTESYDSWLTKATWNSKDLEFELHDPEETAILIR